MLSCLICFVINLSFASASTNIYHYNFTSNPRVNNVTLAINTFQEGSFNFSYDLNVWNVMDIYNETIFIEVLIPKDKKINQFDHSVIKTSVNMCRFAETMENNSFLKQWFRTTDACHPFEMKCPFRKGHYRSNCYFPDVCKGKCANIPDWFPAGKVKISIRFMGKFGKLKRMSELFTFNVFLKYEK